MAARLEQIEQATIKGLDHQGRGKTNVDGKKVLVEKALPGEVVDAKVIRKLKGTFIARATKIQNPSKERVEPFCKHFGVCGGCKWQHINYSEQLKYKTQFVKDAFRDVTDLPEMKPIIGSAQTKFYRNKMEFGFASKRWLTAEEIASGVPVTSFNGLGLHPPGGFDKILDLQECYLQADPSNAIRLEVKRYAEEQQLPFFDPRNQEGFLRQLTIRTTTTGEAMVILTVFEDKPELYKPLLDHLHATFPQIRSLFYVVNDTKNDMNQGKPLFHYWGEEYMTEQFGDVQFQIGPMSFFQTNPVQAKVLYDAAIEMADLQGTEEVYDLYTGLGSIALYIANRCKHVTGIEYVQEAIDHANANAELNGISNCTFIAGDMKDVLKPGYFKGKPKPDLIITDPPRAGMHPAVVKTLLEAEVPRIVYISCNPITQANDIALLQKKYEVKALQPVDMFPQTYHVENIALLELR